jgi:peptidoglycan/xylan/chitin deacetylase (PgdA/CDA1 family)
LLYAVAVTGPVSRKPITRRVVLAVGALAFLQACSHPSEPTATTEPDDGDIGDGYIRGDSHHPIPTPPPTPTLASSVPGSWQPLTPVRPTPGVCPVIGGTVQKVGGPQHYVACQGTNIALTIDDGPDPTWTPLVLKLLSRYGITATFFLIGRSAVNNPKLVAMIADNGHQIGNHTYSHPMPFNQLTRAGIHDQIHRTTDALATLTNAHPTFFRAPGGAWSTTVLAEVASAGLRPLDWSVDPRDWSRPGVPHIVDTILGQTRPGAIILDHDGGGNRQQTVDALTIALPRLLDAGYQFVTPDSPAAP